MTAVGRSSSTVTMNAPAAAADERRRSSHGRDDDRTEVEIDIVLEVPWRMVERTDEIEAPAAVSVHGKREHRLAAGRGDQLVAHNLVGHQDAARVERR